MQLQPRSEYTPGITVLIPFYNEREFLPRLLESLLHQTKLPAKLVLIDNDSTDDSVEIAKKTLAGCSVPFEILHEARKGKANALEQGCQHIESEYTLCTDADTWFPEHTIELAERLFRENPDYSCFLAFGLNEEWQEEEQRTYIHRLYRMSLHHKDRCFSGGYGHFYRSDLFLKAGGYSTEIWPFTLMDHEIIHRMLKYGKRGYDEGLWCYTSFRRTNRKSVRWTFSERFLYRNLPSGCMEWLFYTYLWKRFEKRKMNGLNLREQPWQKGVIQQENEIDKDKKFLAQSSLFSILGTIFKVAGPILMILVARVFDKEAFGVYVSVQLLMLMVSRVIVIGLDKGLHWFIPQNRLNGRSPSYGVAEAFSQSVFIAILIFALGSILAQLGLHRYSTSLETLSASEMMCFLGALVPWAAIHILSGVSEGNRKPQYKIFVNDFAVAVLAPLIGLILHYAGVGRVALPIGLMTANFVGAAMLGGLVLKQFPGLNFFSRHRVDKALMRYSVPIGLSEVVISFLLRADLWMVLLFLGPADAGVYALMVTISNGLRTISLSFSPILLPVVAGMKPERYKTDLKETYSYCVAMVTLIQLAIGFFMVLFPDDVLRIAGNSFVRHPEVLGVLMFGNLMNGFFGLSGTVINGMGKSRFMLKLNAVTLVFALAMNALLIPRFGLMGAAMSTAGYQLLQCVWMNCFLVRMGFWPYKANLFVQGAWILLMLVVYILSNTVCTLGRVEEIVLFVLASLGLLLTLKCQNLMGVLKKKK